MANCDVTRRRRLNFCANNTCHPYAAAMALFMDYSCRFSCASLLRLVVIALSLTVAAFHIDMLTCYVISSRQKQTFEKHSASLSPLNVTCFMSRPSHFCVVTLTPLCWQFLSINKHNCFYNCCNQSESSPHSPRVLFIM